MDVYLDIKLPKKLTFEKVLYVFKDFLAEDNRYEILETLHGYAFVVWDATAKEWDFIKLCDTPQDMMEYLLCALENYVEYLLCILENYMEYKFMRCARNLKNTGLQVP